MSYLHCKLECQRLYSNCTVMEFRKALRWSLILDIFIYTCSEDKMLCSLKGLNIQCLVIFYWVWADMRQFGYSITWPGYHTFWNWPWDSDVWMERINGYETALDNVCRIRFSNAYLLSFKEYKKITCNLGERAGSIEIWETFKAWRWR